MNTEVYGQRSACTPASHQSTVHQSTQAPSLDDITFRGRLAFVLSLRQVAQAAVTGIRFGGIRLKGNLVVVGCGGRCGSDAGAGKRRWRTFRRLSPVALLADITQYRSNGLTKKGTSLDVGNCL
jgi:hypothetical protein